MLNLMNASKAEVEAASQAYRQGLPNAQARLREHLKATDGPDAEGSVGSSAGIGAWYLQHIQDPPAVVGEKPLPAWWDPATPVAGSTAEYPGPFTARQLRLIDEVHAYVVEMLLEAAPDAELAIYKGHSKDFKNGMTLVKSKRFGFHDALSLVYGMALDVVLYDRSVSQNLLFEHLSRVIAKQTPRG